MILSAEKYVDRWDAKGSSLVDDSTLDRVGDGIRRDLGRQV